MKTKFTNGLLIVGIIFSFSISTSAVNAMGLGPVLMEEGGSSATDGIPTGLRDVRPNFFVDKEADPKHDWGTHGLSPAWSPPTVQPAGTMTQTSQPVPPLLNEVHFYNRPLATDFAISALPYTSEESPAIDGSRVVWYDDRTHGPTDVWGYDLTSGEEFQVTSHPVAQFISDIGGDIVAYEDNRNGTWDIYATNLSTGEEFVVATGPHHQRYPRVWGDYIVYQDETADYWQSNVYLYQISTGLTKNLAVAIDFQGDPDIDEGWIVWRDSREGIWQVRAYQIEDDTYHILEHGCGGEVRHPRISGDMVVWQNVCISWPDPGYDIYGYDLLTESKTTIFSGSGQQENPSVSDSLVVWQDKDTYGNWNVFVYVRADGTVFPVTLEPSLQQKPAVYGNTVVWQDNRNHTWDIFGLIWDGILPPGTNFPLPNPTDLHVGSYPDGQIQLSWTDKTSNEEGFVIQRATGIFGTDWQDYVTLPSNTTTYGDSAVDINESYWYRVRAFNSEGDSSYSNESYSTAFEKVPNLDERYMHVLINEARMAPGVWDFPELQPVNPLGWNPNLAYSARAHAVGMNNSGCCQGHVDLAGRGPSERAFDSGYPYGTGENLFVATSGREGMESAHWGFMHSEGHRNNIMASDLRQVAIGFAPESGESLVEVFSGGPLSEPIPSSPSGIVVPYSGTVDTSFDFLVTFWNEQRLAPIQARVYLDGIAYSMDLKSGVEGRGTYIYSTNLPLGQHSYYFEFIWGSSHKQERLPRSGYFEGPYVRPYMVDLLQFQPNSWKLVAGYPSNISATVRNDGEIAAENVEVRFYLGDPDTGGTQIGSQVISSLPSGQNANVEIEWTPPAAGTFDIYVVADPDQQIVEVSEGNNQAHKELTVREAHLTWYVNPEVEVSGDGRSPETAFLTISEAMPNAYQGDTVSVAEGTYQERFTIPAGVAMIGGGAEVTTIDGAGDDGSVIAMESNSLIDGFTITGSGGEHYDAGIWHSTGPITIRRNRFIHNSVGIFSWCSNPECEAEATIENNIFAENTRVGVDANDEPIHFIINNTIVGNGRGLVLNNSESIAENNIVVGNAGDGIAVSKTGTTIRFNDVWGNGNNYVGAVPGEGSISGDPLFVDQSSGDYRLFADSPAVDSGNPDIAYLDINGTRCDMGAFGGPYGAWSLLPAPLAPTILIAPTIDGVELTWTHLEANASYQVWRDTVPYFDPDNPGPNTTQLPDADPPVSGDTVVYTDTTVVPNTNYYYLVRGVNSRGDVSSASNPVGVFYFIIEPGS